MFFRKRDKVVLTLTPRKPAMPAASFSAGAISC